MNSSEDYAKFVKDCLKPFHPSEIDQLPKGGINLDYVSHANVTKRLLEVDPFWHWDFVAQTAEGLPLFDSNGGLWIRLTVKGVSRYGYGEPVGGFTPADKVKSAIGDAIRNAAMRFGIALDLWRKQSEETTPPKVKKAPPVIELKNLLASMGATNQEEALNILWEKTGHAFKEFTEMGSAEALELIKELTSE